MKMEQLNIFYIFAEIQGGVKKTSGLQKTSSAMNWPKGCYDCSYKGKICCKLENGDEECRKIENCPSYGIQECLSAFINICRNI